MVTKSTKVIRSPPTSNVLRSKLSSREEAVVSEPVLEKWTYPNHPQSTTQIQVPDRASGRGRLATVRVKKKSIRFKFIKFIKLFITKLQPQ